MRTKVYIRDEKGVIVASVVRSTVINTGVDSLSYDEQSGSMTIEHSGKQLQISGSVKGDLTIKGRVNPTRIKTGGALVLSGYS